MNRRMRCAKAPLAVPPAVGHLLPEHMVGKRVEAVVVVLEIGEEREHHSADTGLTRSPPSVVDAAVALQTPVEKQPAGLPRLPVGGWQTGITEQQHRIGG